LSIIINSIDIYQKIVLLGNEIKKSGLVLSPRLGYIIYLYIWALIDKERRIGDSSAKGTSSCHRKHNTASIPPFLARKAMSSLV